jgi:hypothetical protein
MRRATLELFSRADLSSCHFTGPWSCKLCDDKPPSPSSVATSVASKGETPPRPPAKRARPTDYGFNNQPDFNDASASESESGPVRKVTLRVNGTDPAASDKRRSSGGNKSFSGFVKRNGVRMKAAGAQREAITKAKAAAGSDDASDKEEEDEEEDEEEQVPFGGLITGAEADTARSRLSELDRRLFAETAARVTYEVRRPQSLPCAREAGA